MTKRKKESEYREGFFVLFNIFRILRQNFFHLRISPRPSSIPPPRRPRPTATDTALNGASTIPPTLSSNPPHTPAPSVSTGPEEMELELDFPASPPPVEDLLAARRAKRQAILAKYNNDAAGVRSSSGSATLVPTLDKMQVKNDNSANGTPAPALSRAVSVSMSVNNTPAPADRVSERQFLAKLRAYT